MSPVIEGWRRHAALGGKLRSFGARTLATLSMGLAFFFVVTPIGVLMRALGRDPMRLKRDPNARSYWIERTPPGPAAETVEK